MVFVGYVAVFLPSVVTLLTLVWQLFISRPEKNPVGGVAVAVSVLAGTGVAWLMFEGASVATGVSLDPLWWVVPGGEMAAQLGILWFPASLLRHWVHRRSAERQDRLLRKQGARGEAADPSGPPRQQPRGTVSGSASRRTEVPGSQLGLVWPGRT